MKETESVKEKLLHHIFHSGDGEPVTQRDIDGDAVEDIVWPGVNEIVPEERCCGDGALDDNVVRCGL